MRRWTGRVGLVLALALGAAGCDNEIDVPTTPTTPTNVIIESFSGSLTPNGAVTYFYSATGAGTITATLITLAPDTSISLGLAIGTWNGATCQTVIANDRASLGSTVTGQASNAGALCVRIYDANGTIPATTKFEVVVVHP
jgi:hypothetical protein